MDNPTRVAWRRLPWRQWLAKGTLLGLCAATVLGLAAFATQREAAVLRHPLLADWWWTYIGLGVCTLLALLAVMSRLRSGIGVLILLSAAVFAFESQVLGWGLHLLRIPLSLMLAIWADRALRV
jgi:hypothetical protein